MSTGEDEHFEGDELVACERQPCPNRLLNPTSATSVENTPSYAVPAPNQHPIDIEFDLAIANLGLPLHVQNNPTPTTTQAHTPVPTMAQITLTPDQLNALIANAVQAAIAALPTPTAPTPTPPPAITLNTHEKPGKYKGEKGRDLERFISQCDAYYALSGITTDVTKVISALGRLEDKAAQWAIHVTDHMAANNGQLPAEVDSWTKFKELLRCNRFA